MLAAWVGWTAAPLAWAAQHVIGIFVAIGTCSAGGTQWHIPLDGIALGVTIVAVAIGLAGLAASIVALRDTRGAEAPPAERVHFMAIIGLAITPLFLAIMLMSGPGAIILDNCVQS